MYRVVAVLERVQGGIIGATLSSFGITGLYITFVFGAARVLRSATVNNRMRIQYEDLPTTRRLTALCQARARLRIFEWAVMGAAWLHSALPCMPGRPGHGHSYPPEQWTYA